MIRRTSSLLFPLFGLSAFSAQAADVPERAQPAKFHYHKPPKVIAEAGAPLN